MLHGKWWCYIETKRQMDYMETGQLKQKLNNRVGYMKTGKDKNLRLHIEQPTTHKIPHHIPS